MNQDYLSPQLTTWYFTLQHPLLNGSNYDSLSNEDFSSDGQLTFE